MSEYYGVTTPTDDFLAHYGVKGMKWGVRKAIAKGSDRALGRQYKKASKKLAKLEKQASSGKKYAKRAAALSVGAAAAGGLAAVGTRGAGHIVRGVGTAMQEAGYGASRLAGKHIKNSAVRGAIQAAGRAVGGAGTAVKGVEPGIHAWGKSNNIASKASNALGGVQNGTVQNLRKNMANVSNNTIARIGAGAVGAGLAGAAGYNAYRAATTKKAAKKAQQFRSEMNKAFAGTKYANGNPTRNKKKAKR